MGASDITVAALTATPGIGYIGLTWTYADPRSGALPNLALDMVEVWGSTTNDRTTAAKVAEGITSARHSGVANGVTWYYWIKARDNIGGYGAFHPVSTTAGVSGTEATATQVTLSALTAVANVSQVSLQWAITDPSSNGLGYLGLAAVEVWAASTNDRAGAAKVTEGLTSAVHDGIPEGETRYYWVRPRNRNGTNGSFFPTSATAGVAGVARDQVGLLFSGLSNGKIVPSASAGALTIAIKSLAGNNPSASDPDKIFTSFPNATLATGNYQIRQITSALSLVISSGSTLGAPSGTPFRLWLILIDDGGTLRLGLIKCIDINRWQIYPLRKRIVSAVSEGGAGAADDNGVVYANATVTSKPFRVLGYLEWPAGLATAGTWTWTETEIVRMYGMGDPLPGDTVQPATIITPNTLLSNTTTIPLDNTAPQSGEGSELTVWALSLAATSLANVIDYEAGISVSNNTGSLHMIGAVFKDSEASAYATDAVKIGAANDIARLHVHNRFFPDDLSSHTYKLRVGGSSAGTWTVNGVNGAGMFGAELQTFSSAREVMT